MEIDLVTNPMGQIYLPKNIRAHWGTKYTMLPNERAGVIYPRGTSPNTVIKSLEVIIHALKNRIDENTG